MKTKNKHGFTSSNEVEYLINHMNDKVLPNGLSYHFELQVRDEINTHYILYTDVFSEGRQMYRDIISASTLISLGNKFFAKHYFIEPERINLLNMIHEKM